MTSDLAGRTEPAHDRADPQAVVLAWWREHIADKDAPAGPRAELKRATTLEEVVFAPLFHELRLRLASTSWRSVTRLALVAGVLAGVREHDVAKAFAAQMSESRQGARAAPSIAPSRFRRILRLGESEEDLEQLFTLVRRVVALLEQRVNVTNLAEGLYWWGPETRKRWAMAYYEHVNERALTSE